MSTTSNLEAYEQARRCREALVAFMTTSSGWGKRELAAWLAGVYAAAPHGRPARDPWNRAPVDGPLTDAAVHGLVAEASEQLQAIFQLARSSGRPLAVAQLVLQGEGSCLGDRVCALWARSYLATRGATGDDLLEARPAPQDRQEGDEPGSGVYSIIPGSPDERVRVG
jgi:hypothetical protein